jgi:phospholipid/cholesterol/gamma-HCH transport system substrate-binding protein
VIQRRTWANLVAVAAAGVALLVYGFAQLLAGALFNPTYALALELPRAGGVIPGQQVTLNGVPIGKVEHVRLEGDGVVAGLRIREDAAVPTGSDAVVLRRTPVGEQGIDLRPAAATSRVYEPGERIVPRELRLPPEISDVVATANDVVAPIASEDARIVVHEVANALRGRQREIRSILADSADFSETVADRGSDYDRMFAASRVVNGELAEHRDTIARLIAESADAAATLEEIRGDFEGLLDSAPPVLRDVDETVGRSQPNISCLITDVADLATYLAEPRQLENMEGALRANQYFFVGFSIISPEDGRGHSWQRIQLVLHLTPPADSYLPAKRPIPDILPGQACRSPFGHGAPGAQQPDFRKTIPEARFVPPGGG